MWVTTKIKLSILGKAKYYKEARHTKFPILIKLANFMKFC